MLLIRLRHETLIEAKDQAFGERGSRTEGTEDILGTDQSFMAGDNSASPVLSERIYYNAPTPIPRSPSACSVCSVRE